MTDTFTDALMQAAEPIDRASLPGQLREQLEKGDRYRENIEKAASLLALFESMADYHGAIKDIQTILCVHFIALTESDFLLVQPNLDKHEMMALIVFRRQLFMEMDMVLSGIYEFASMHKS
ncbi:hypothetical protein [Aliagarivorans taiwanensis]|uniref:hypothetical protein n=1 Tax=Aliagarivorans taiwanensis TaxID=561966 RepID=UPI0004158C0D|nr:hypothetical protein [Aliagarivorans taiwanensis]